MAILLLSFKQLALCSLGINSGCVLSPHQNCGLNVMETSISPWNYEA